MRLIRRCVGVFKLILFMGAFFAQSAMALDMLDLNGAWTLRAVMCLSPAAPETRVGDTRDTWSFDGSVYETHIDGSHQGEYPQCADLYSHGHYVGYVDGSTFHLDFVPDQDNDCHRPVSFKGPNTALENGVNLPGETFSLENKDGQLLLYEDFNSSESCQRQRRIYIQAPVS